MPIQFRHKTVKSAKIIQIWISRMLTLWFKLIFIIDIEDDNIKWEADENVIWLYNTETLKIESVDYKD